VPDPPRAPWAGKSLAERQAEARALLAQAGYGPGHPLKLEITTSIVGDNLLVEAIQADWRAIGVQPRIRLNDVGVMFAAFRNRDFQVGAMSWYADFNDPLTFLGLFKSDTGAQNYGDYDNPAYDALLAAADHQADPAARGRLLAQAEQTMLNDEATMPIYFVVSRNLVSLRATGWVDNAPDLHRARYLCLKR